jgi:hypothetical protein
MARSSGLKASALLALAAVLIVGAPEVRPQDDDEKDELDRTPEDCIPVNRIDRDKAVDNRTIIFYMRGGAAFRNDLPGVCPNMKAGETRFVYNFAATQAIRLQQLCDTDTITIERTTGFNCSLGPFVPITKEEADAFFATTAPAATPPAGQN